jgi:hypothetical protein
VGRASFPSGAEWEAAPRALALALAGQTRASVNILATAALLGTQKNTPGASARSPASRPLADILAAARYGNSPALYLHLAPETETDEARSPVSPTPSVVNQDRRCRRDDRDALIAPRLTPARLTQSSTSYEVEDWEAARGYFFFRRYLAFVFLWPFFAVFAYDFRFFAMLPS